MFNLTPLQLFSNVLKHNLFYLGGLDMPYSRLTLIKLNTRIMLKFIFTEVNVIQAKLFFYTSLKIKYKQRNKNQKFQ